MEGLLRGGSGALVVRVMGLREDMNEAEENTRRGLVAASWV